MFVDRAYEKIVKTRFSLDRWHHRQFLRNRVVNATTVLRDRLNIHSAGF
jgi:hypothetical protein